VFLARFLDSLINDGFVLFVGLAAAALLGIAAKPLQGLLRKETLDYVLFGSHNALIIEQPSGGLVHGLDKPSVSSSPGNPPYPLGWKRRKPLSLRSKDYTVVVDYRKMITIEPGKRGGKPCIRGMRITVYDVLTYLASGTSHEEVLRDFPYLTEEDIRACLAYAADRERTVVVVSR